MACNRTIFKQACVEADITLTPDITLGPVNTVCIGNPMQGECPNETEMGSCTFDVHQEVCVRIPIMFNVNAAVTEQEIVCEGFFLEPCPGATPG